MRMCHCICNFSPRQHDFGLKACDRSNTWTNHGPNSFANTSTFDRAYRYTNFASYRLPNGDAEWFANAPTKSISYWISNTKAKPHQAKSVSNRI